MTENETQGRPENAAAAFAEGSHAARAQRLPFVATPTGQAAPEPLIPIDADTIGWRNERWVRQSIADGAYSERNRIVALLAALFRPASHIGFTDPSTPDYAVAVVETPYGQASWHVPPRDFPFFRGTPESGPQSTTYDGHTTAEKYGRLETMRLSLLGDPPAAPVAAAEPAGELAQGAGRLAAEVVVDVAELEGDGDLDELKRRLEEALAPWRPTITVNERRY